MRLYIIRTLAIDCKSKLWVLCDGKNKLVGRPGESKRAIIDRWALAYDRPTHLTRYSGVLRPSETAATIASLMAENQGK